MLTYRVVSGIFRSFPVLRCRVAMFFQVEPRVGSIPPSLRGGMHLMRSFIRRPTGFTARQYGVPEEQAKVDITKRYPAFSISTRVLFNWFSVPIFAVFLLFM